MKFLKYFFLTIFVLNLSNSFSMDEEFYKDLSQSDYYERSSQIEKRFSELISAEPFKLYDIISELNHIISNQSKYRLISNFRIIKGIISKIINKLVTKSDIKSLEAFFSQIKCKDYFAYPEDPYYAYLSLSPLDLSTKEDKFIEAVFTVLIVNKINFYISFSNAHIVVTNGKLENIYSTVESSSLTGFDACERFKKLLNTAIEKSKIDVI